QTARNSHETYSLLNTMSFDLAILDINLPDEDGISLCKNISSNFNFPIIMLTASNDKSDLLICLNVGADYYLTKPFDEKILLSYIRAALRKRYVKNDYQNRMDAASKKPIYKFKNWTLDTKNRTLFNNSNIQTILTCKEYQLLLTFLQNPHYTFSREKLSDIINNKNITSFDRSIDVLISKVRKKIESEESNKGLIKTLRNAGYLFACDVEIIL
ncbi:MAG: response regulator transcription factor, partial [Legionellales bacterium]|nr:response regulator transcription factor [Legionellales bacterium]